MKQFSALNDSVSRKILAALYCLFLGNYISGLSAGDTDQEPNEQELCGRSIDGKIVGGEPVKPGDHPWIVSIQGRSGKGFGHACGGTIIDKEWIVTAAHCLETNQNPEHYRAVVGLYKQSEQDDDRVKHLKISKIIVHEGYESEHSKNDIGLMKTEEPIDFREDPYVEKICMPKPGEDPSGKVIAAGWGDMHENGESSDVLQHVEVPIVPIPKCQEKYKGKSVSDEQVCAGEENKDSCQADSGGPLIVHDTIEEKSTLIGITSYGHGCGRKGWPGVYTNFAKYLDWVKDKMNE